VNYSWPIERDPGKITVESMRVEPIRIQGGRETKGLVVRLRYPKDQEPFSVRLRDWKGNEEHRFYTDPGKYTAIFYPMTEAEARKQSALFLISIAEFKKQAMTLEEKRLELGKPKNFRRPPPP
jgi:hypothetical protein